MRSAVLAAVFCLSIGPLLVGCKDHKPVLPPDIKMNPAPKQRFEITITMEKAPASLQTFNGDVQYDIENYLECVPVDYTRSLGGSHPSFNREVTIEFVRVEGNTFKGEFVGDLLLNEDYYGLGLCHWAPAGVDVELDRPDSGSPRLGVAAVHIMKSGRVVERYCLEPERVRLDILASCPGFEGMLSRKEPKEWYYKVSIQAKEKINVDNN